MDTPEVQKAPAPSKTRAKVETKAKSDDTESVGVKAEQSTQGVEIWPMRSYQDAGEIKRRGGPSYTVPKRHADLLVARKLASLEAPKNTGTKPGN